MPTPKPISGAQRMEHIRDRYEAALNKMRGPWSNYGKISFVPDSTDEFFNIAPKGSVWEEEKGIFCTDGHVAQWVAQAPDDLEYMIELVETSTKLVDEMMRRMELMVEFAEEQYKAYSDETYREGGRTLTAITRMRDTKTFLKNMMEEGHGGGIEEK